MEIIIGKKYNRLTVIERCGIDDRGYKTWLCKCDCGNFKVATTSGLNLGKTKSCGCLAYEIKHKRFNPNAKSKTRLYQCWADMKTRCKNKKDSCYNNYGGRGIKVCDEWNESFDSFRDWSMNNGYQENLSIDRIDNNGNYEPSNCKWSNYKEQARNTRTNTIVEYNGVKATLSEICEIYKADYKRVCNRLMRGWNIKDAIEIPPKEVGYFNTKRVIYENKI